MTYEEALKERYKAVRERLNPQKPPINRALEFRPECSQHVDKTDGYEVIHKIEKKYFIKTYGIVTEPLQVELPVTFASIVKFVVAHTGMNKTSIFSNRRGREYVQARRAVWVLAKEHLTFSLPQIGRYSGGFDHTTVLHSIKNFHPESIAGEIVAAFNGSHKTE